MDVIQYNRVKAIITLLWNKVPSKIDIVLLFIDIWSWIAMRWVQLLNFILRSIILCTPTSVLPNFTPKIPVKIIKAMDDNGNEITKQLKIFMKFKWDNEMCDDRGGVDLDTFTKYIGSTVVWVAYILDYDIDDDLCEKFMNIVNIITDKDQDPSSLDDSNQDTSSNKTNLDTDIDLNMLNTDSLHYFKKCIRIIVINTSKKIAYKLKKNTTALDEEDILFGELDFF